MNKKNKPFAGFLMKTGLVGIELPAKRFAIRNPLTGRAMYLGAGNVRPSCRKKEDGREGNQKAPAGFGGSGVHLERLASRGLPEQSLFLGCQPRKSAKFSSVMVGSGRPLFGGGRGSARFPAWA